jgi:DNA-binding beta-propeller fold protein YncE
MHAIFRHFMPLGLSLLGMVLSLAACSTASHSGARSSDSTAPVLWPPPPAPARIAHMLNAARPSDLGVKVKGFTRFGNWLTGATKGNAPFGKPFGIAFDEADNLLMTDTANNVVCWLETATHRWHQWNQIEGVRFNLPVAVAKVGSTIWVADPGAREVVAFGVNGKLRFRIRDGVVHPAGLAIRGRQVLVADSQQHLVLVFDLEGRRTGQIGGRGTGAGEFNFPTHLATDPQGRLYVTDSMNSRIQVFDHEGKFIRQIGSVGDSPGYFGRPKGVAVDGNGSVFVLDAMFDNLQIFDFEGRLLLSLGDSGSAPGEFWLPNGIAICRDQRIFIADSFNHRIQVLKPVRAP